MLPSGQTSKMIKACRLEGSISDFFIRQSMPRIPGPGSDGLVEYLSPAAVTALQPARRVTGLSAGLPCRQFVSLTRRPISLPAGLSALSAGLPCRQFVSLPAGLFV